jgi:hypothetical protein
MYLFQFITSAGLGRGFAAECAYCNINHKTVKYPKIL